MYAKMLVFVFDVGKFTGVVADVTPSRTLISQPNEKVFSGANPMNHSSIPFGDISGRILALMTQPISVYLASFHRGWVKVCNISNEHHNSPAEAKQLNCRTMDK